MDNSPAQRTPEWFAQRKGRVTGSAVGAILGVNPYMTRADVLRRMVRDSLGAPSEFTGNIATSWGTNNESGALVEFQMETGLTVKDAPFVLFEDWLGASPDGYTSDDGLVEVKCPYGLRNAEGPVPFKTAAEQPHYYAQMQVQMFVTKTSLCHFYQWAPRGTRHEIVELDHAWVQSNLSRLKQFHAEYLDELENNPDEHLGPKRPEIDTPQSRAVMEEYEAVSEALERATARKKELMDQLVNMAGGQSVIIAGRKLTLTERQGAISYAKAVKELCPDADLSKWRGKPTSYWQIR